MEKKWLISDEDFDSEDWHFEAYPDMGIMSESYCEDLFLYTRFEDEQHTDCPRCRNKYGNYMIKNKANPKCQFKCKKCDKIFSITAGTYLDNSKLKYTYWYRIAYLIADLKFPINSRALSRSMGLTQKTTYNMLLTIKKAMNIESKGAVKGLNFSIPDKTNWHDILVFLLKTKQPHGSNKVFEG